MAIDVVLVVVIIVIFIYLFNILYGHNLTTLSLAKLVNIFNLVAA